MDTHKPHADKAHNKPELLAPAGGTEQLEYALHYGADAVYLGIERFGLRVRADNLTLDDLGAAVKLVHGEGKKLFVATNAILHQEDLGPFTHAARALQEAGVDAAIVSDPAAFTVVQEHAPDVALHISTQMSCANAGSVEFWRDRGAKRVVLARELSMAEIATIKDVVGDSVELEVFVHGAMCMAYSGRCLISNYLTGRDANRGHCTQPCRWGYDLIQGDFELREETRPGQSFSIEEDARGTYLMNSKDLMMLDHMDEIAATGVDSVKIEGRMKGAYYVATVTNAYRQVIDGADPRDFLPEMDKVSHRPYSTGFYFSEAQQTPASAEYQQTHDLVADVRTFSGSSDGGQITFALRNRIFEGDELEVLTPGEPVRSFIARDLRDEWDTTVEVAKGAMALYSMEVPFELKPKDLLRKHREHVTRPEPTSDRTSAIKR